MKKIMFFLMVLSLILVVNVVNATVSLNTVVIPVDGNKKSYNSLVGYNETTRQWNLLKTKTLPDGTQVLDLGTPTVQIEGSSINFVGTVNAVSTISEPIWQSQPGLRYNTLSIELPVLGNYTYNGTQTVISGYWNSLEYLVITRQDTSPMDYLNYNLYVNTLDTPDPVLLVLGGEITPATPQSIWQPPTAIIFKDKYQLVIQNKCNTIQNINVGIITSYRKINIIP